MAQEIKPIGIFDSGVGGLSVLSAIRERLPHEDLLYFADQANVPYGSRTLREVQDLAEAITRFLLSQGAKIIVVACNTASAASLHSLRARFPHVPFVGMEPAIKPAAEQTQSGVIGVLATPATFQGALYASLLDRFADEVTILQDTCPGLVSQIEAGDLAGPQTQYILDVALRPMLTNNADMIVLGCTHYPFVITLIQQIIGPKVKVIDPAPAIARQTGRVLRDMKLSNQSPRMGKSQIFTTGDPHHLQALLPHLFQSKPGGSEGLTQSELVNTPVKFVHWHEGQLLVQL